MPLPDPPSPRSGPRCPRPASHPRSAARVAGRGSATLAAGRAVGTLVVAAIVGCAAPGSSTSTSTSTSAPAPAPGVLGAPGCDAFAETLDDTVRRAGTGDAQASRVAGARWLRTDRFAASFADEALAPDARRAWLEQLREHDAGARRVEVANLPPDARAAAAPAARAVLAAVGLLSPTRPQTAPDDAASADASAVASAPTATATATATVAAAVAHCGRAEIDAIDGDADALERLRRAVRVPDDYVAWQRTLGLYPIAVLPFGAGVRREEAATSAAFARHAGRVAEGTTVFAPQRAAAPAGDGPPPSIADRDALDVPRLDPVSRTALLAAHAPLWALEGDGDDDRFGALVLDDDGRARVDVARPVVHARVAFTRWEGRVRVQLVYAAWFPRRAPAGVLDPLAGHLDGVLLRLTLDEAGRVAMVDSIHACGCWHLFVPVGPWRTRPAPVPGDEWALVPARLDAVPPGARVRVRLAARTHAVEGLDVATSVPPTAAGYRLVDDDGLRTLPHPRGGTRSLYDARGLVPGTERGERWLFWPMGVAEPGAMRQWGRHATAFVGRRHFDEADLLERRFERDIALR
ncbi:MAG: hypothetical protein RJA99_4333 [Pseudomonadota bacterium]|jgi:hypothetical protein